MSEKSTTAGQNVEDILNSVREQLALLNRAGISLEQILPPPGSVHTPSLLPLSTGTQGTGGKPPGESSIPFSFGGVCLSISAPKMAIGALHSDKRGRSISLLASHAEEITLTLMCHYQAQPLMSSTLTKEGWKRATALTSPDLEASTATFAVSSKPKRMKLCNSTCKEWEQFCVTSPAESDNRHSL